MSSSESSFSVSSISELGSRLTCYASGCNQFVPSLIVYTNDEDDIPSCSSKKIICSDFEDSPDCCMTKRKKRKSCAKPRRTCRKPASRRKRSCSKPKACRRPRKMTCRKRKPCCPKPKPRCPKPKPRCPKRC